MQVWNLFPYINTLNSSKYIFQGFLLKQPQEYLFPEYFNSTVCLKGPKNSISLQDTQCPWGQKQEGVACCNRISPLIISSPLFW